MFFYVLQTLPPFISSVSPIEGSLNNWAAPSPNYDPRALQDPSGGPPGIGCAFASMTLGVDVHMAAAAVGTWYQVGRIPPLLRLVPSISRPASREDGGVRR